MCVCVRVPVTWYAIDLNLNLMLSLTWACVWAPEKHVLVSVVVQMTDNLVISLACCPEFTVITWFRPFNGELACCDIPGVVIRSILRGSPPLNGRLHVMLCDVLFSTKGTRVCGDMSGNIHLICLY